jgi:hypothetical protein
MARKTVSHDLLTAPQLKACGKSYCSGHQKEDADHGEPAAIVPHNDEQDLDHAHDRPDAAENQHAADGRERTSPADIPWHTATTSQQNSP